MNPIVRCIISLLVLGFNLIGLCYGQAQGSQTEFGKNRVQFKEFQWFYYHSPHFDTYYYKEGKELGAMVGRIAEQNLKEIENTLDYKLAGRIEILAYNKLSDLVQTNLGLITDQQQNIGGITPIVGNKLFIYFDGNTEHLYKQIRAGIAEVLINELLYGGNLQEKLSNSTLLTLPDWFIPGLKSYLAEPWNVELDNSLKDGILNGRYKKFNRMASTDSKTAGHSIWKYIVDNFGSSSISNIIYMTRVNRNAENGFIYIVGLDFKELGEAWLNFYKKQYINSANTTSKDTNLKQFVHLGKKRNAALDYKTFKYSPDGKKLAYLINKSGKIKVYVLDLNTKKTKKVYKSGVKSSSFVSDNEDVNITWHPSSLLLAISHEQKSMPQIKVLNLVNKKDDYLIKMYKYEKILDLDYSADGRKWVLSAIKNGQSDLYLFDIMSRRDEQITDDWFDDLNPRFYDRSNKIVFSSNRITDTLHKEVFRNFPIINNYDLFLFDLTKPTNDCKRIISTPFDNETKPIEYAKDKIAYLTDQSGIINRKILSLDSAIAYQYDTTIFYYDTTIVVFKDSFSTIPNSNYARNIDKHDISKKSRIISDILSNKNLKFGLIATEGITDTSLWTNFAMKKKTQLEKVLFKFNSQKKLAAIALIDSINNSRIEDSLAAIKDTSQINIPLSSDYFFQTTFPRIKSEKTIPINIQTANGNQIIYLSEKKKKKTNKEKNLDDYFSKSAPIPYLPSFSTSYIVSQVDNSLITNSYQQFTGVGPIYINAAINALIKVGAADLLEDYRFIGGFRLSGNLTIPEYFLSYENLKKRIDKQFIFYKQGGDDYQGAGANRTNSYEFKSIFKYPFNEQSAIKTSFFYRRDERITLATDSFSLNLPNFNSNNIGFRVEYVYDNTINKGLNLYNGSRYKLYIEEFLDIDDSKNKMVNIGFDFRHYQKLTRQIIFAGRLAGSSSIAAQKVMYYLGGVDSWFTPKFNNGIQIDKTRDYKYQALATNLRGFNQNIRNGNNFLVANAELRIPVFAYLLNRPIKSDFIKNFQIMPFADVGAAWLGADPFSKENRFNKLEVQGSPVKVTIIEPKYPIVGGYGWGARSRLLGYFVRFDMAWGVQNNVVNKNPVYYISLSLDF